MTIVNVPFNIYTKNRRNVVVVREDTIQLHEFQKRQMQNGARLKSLRDWHRSPFGVKVTLTPDQQNDLIAVKDAIFTALSSTKNPKEILWHQSRAFQFTPHAFKRILERVERLTEEEIEILGTPHSAYPVEPETLENLVEALGCSKVVRIKAEWKVYEPFINFSFICELENRQVEMVVNFENGILIVTLFIKKETGFFVREIYSIDGKSIKKKPSI